MELTGLAAGGRQLQQTLLASVALKKSCPFMSKCVSTACNPVVQRTHFVVLLISAVGYGHWALHKQGGFSPWAVGFLIMILVGRMQAKLSTGTYGMQGPVTGKGYWSQLEQWGQNAPPPIGAEKCAKALWYFSMIVTPLLVVMWLTTEPLAAEPLNVLLVWGFGWGVANSINILNMGLLLTEFNCGAFFCKQQAKQLVKKFESARQQLEVVDGAVTLEDAMQAYVDLQQTMTTNSKAWQFLQLSFMTLSLLGFISFSVIFAATVHLLGSMSAFFIAFWLFVTLTITITPLFSSMAINTTCENVPELFKFSKSNDFASIGGRDLWLNYIASNPIYFTIYGVAITSASMTPIVSAVVGSLLPIGIPFILSMVEFAKPPSNSTLV